MNDEMKNWLSSIVSKSELTVEDETELKDWATYYLDSLKSPKTKPVDKLNKKSKSDWQSEAPTQKQIRYLRKLGCKMMPKNKGEAGHLISEYQKSKNKGN